MMDADRKLTKNSELNFEATRTNGSLCMFSWYSPNAIIKKKIDENKNRKGLFICVKL